MQYLFSNILNETPCIYPNHFSAQKYKNNSLGLCEFHDAVSRNYPNSHVMLVGPVTGKDKDKDKVTMKFNKNGRFSTKRCGQHRMRHQKKCYSADFLVIPSVNPTNDPCGCPEAREFFCQTKLRNMPELREICNLTWPRSNETYET